MPDMEFQHHCVSFFFLTINHYQERNSDTQEHLLRRSVPLCWPTFAWVQNSTGPCCCAACVLNTVCVLTNWSRHLSPLQHNILGDAPICVDIHALIFVAQEHLHAIGFREHHDGVRSHATLDLREGQRKTHRLSGSSEYHQDLSFPADGSITHSQTRKVFSARVHHCVRAATELQYCFSRM